MTSNSAKPDTANGTLTAEAERAVRAATAKHAARPGALLPILHEIQRALGFVPPASVALIADALNLSRADVHGVISFYHLFRSAPPGERVVYVCRAEACQSMGAREIEAHLKRSLAIDFHETTADGGISLEPIYCLGNCACAPAVMIDETVHGRVTPELLDGLLR